MRTGESLAELRIGEFVSEYFERIYYYCLKKTGRESEAAEISQETALAVIEQLRRGACPESFSGWVWQIVRNIYSRWAKEKRTMRERFECSDLSEYEIPDEGDFVSELIRKEDIALVRRELAFVISEYRNILLMYYVHGRRISEIADKMNIPEGTVKTRLFRARQKLKEGMNMAREFGKRSYDPERLNFGSSGRQPSGLPWSAVRRKIPVNILCEANNNPSTIEELAIELGIAVPYMEEEVSLLENAELLKKLDDGKYITSFFIAPKECIEEINELCEDFAFDTHAKFWKIARDFTEKHYAEFIGESTVSIQDATMFFTLKLIDKVKNTSDGGVWDKFSRKDGSNWGFIGFEQGAREGRIRACCFSDNGTGNGSPFFRAYIAEGSFGKSVFKNKCFNFGDTDVKVMDELVKNGYCTAGFTASQNEVVDILYKAGYIIKDGDKYKPNLLVFEDGELSGFINLMISEHKDEVDAVTERIKKFHDDAVNVISKYSVPYLKDDMGYYVAMMSFGIRDDVAQLVKENGLYTGGNGDFGYFSYRK